MIPTKGSWGIDIGASSAVTALAHRGELALRVYPQLGLGTKLDKLGELMPVESIMSWLSVEATENMVRDYMHTKAIYPASIPATEQEKGIEQAIARQVIRAAVQQTIANLPFEVQSAGPGLLPWVEPILATGGYADPRPNAWTKPTDLVRWLATCGDHYHGARSK